MKFLINCSNLDEGGGLQVAKSVIGQLNRYPNHFFFIVASTNFGEIKIQFDNNIKLYRYNIRHSLKTVLLGRDSFLDRILEDNQIDAVLTIFGPSVWRPRSPHLCGFARAQLVLKDSPYYNRVSIKERFVYKVWTWMFRSCSSAFYSENSYISKKLPDLLGKDVSIYTVTNYYNQIFDQPESWLITKQLPAFKGITVLSVSSHYSHKNFEILIEVARVFKRSCPSFKYRFVLTFNETEMYVPDDVRSYFLFIGKVDIKECPYLYKQADIMFMPTLMECFTATYPEAMRMGVPVVTTDLEFAHGLCGNAACYYSPVDPQDAADALHKVSTDRKYALQLIEEGYMQLKKFDDYEQRALKLITILEEISRKG